MKHLLTLAALLVSTLSLAQFTPYNPDADNDQFVGAQDLLAFLPLFGEDWDLDSLTIYATSELATPEWCAHPGCMSLCSDENFLIVPPDADIVYHDQISEQRLLLPPTPKTLVIFGIANYTASLSRETVLCENGENSGPKSQVLRNCSLTVLV